jgi:hypothetical protein
VASVAVSRSTGQLTFFGILAKIVAALTLSGPYFLLGTLHSGFLAPAYGNSYETKPDRFVTGCM